ncbi:hypothetical protein [Streptomyces sp. GC420]|uniref:hypothetical protein n=1 Tax=Streptomyces sp. GC420 TaxID=2697568 RepID=UPI0014151BEA|nr:hypothetical protein [Streptomyces sp. GC420]NBM21042.1 hypothetical protein [Streptomyces sp. GC420]
MTDSSRASSDSATDQQVIDRLVPAWLEEAAQYEANAVDAARKGWQKGRLSPEAARELADWVTARVTDTGFNADKESSQQGAVRVSVADKAAVHRWLTAHGHQV